MNTVAIYHRSESKFAYLYDAFHYTGGVPKEIWFE